MIIEYTDSLDHPTVVGWLVDERPSLRRCVAIGYAWRQVGGWAYRWRTWMDTPSMHGRDVGALRCARGRVIGYGNGKRHGGHTSVTTVALMSRPNILALMTVDDLLTVQ